MISVSEAQALIGATNISFSIKEISLHKALGSYLAEPIRADRDFPPYHRVTMDGIAIAHKDWELGTPEFSNFRSAACWGCSHFLWRRGKLCRDHDGGCFA